MLLDIINELKSSATSLNCYPYVGHISTLHQWNTNDYPFVGIQFNSCDEVINYQFTIYYLEVIPADHPELTEEAIFERGIAVVLKMVKDMNYSNVDIQAVRNTGTDCTSGVVMEVTITEQTDPECL